MTDAYNTYKIKDNALRTTYFNTGYISWTGVNIYAKGPTGIYEGPSTMIVTENPDLTTQIITPVNTTTTSNPYGRYGFKMNYQGIYEFTINIAINTASDNNVTWNTLFTMNLGINPNNTTQIIPIGKQNSTGSSGQYENDTTTGFYFQNMSGNYNTGSNTTNPIPIMSSDSYIYWSFYNRINSGNEAYQHTYTYNCILYAPKDTIIYPGLSINTSSPNDYYVSTTKLPFTCKLIKEGIPF